MRKVIVSEFVTLDGVMEDPGGAEGFKHGGWSFQFGSADQQQFKVEELFQADALLLGRWTYQGFAAAWPTMPGTGAYGERMNSLPKYVVSTTLSEVTWNATLITGDLTEALPRLKQEAGQDILIFGSGQLTHTLNAGTSSTNIDSWSFRSYWAAGSVSSQTGTKRRCSDWSRAERSLQASCCSPTSLPNHNRAVSCWTARRT